MKNATPIGHAEAFFRTPVALREAELQPLLQARAHHMMRADFYDAVYDLEPKALKLDVQNGYAVIPIRGAIGMGLAEWEKQWLGMCDVDDVRELFEEAIASQSVKAIALMIDSPGGCVTGIPELASAIYAGRTAKPILAFSRSVCASAAYWLGCQAHALYAAPSAVIGSIGVYTVLYDVSQLYKEHGYKVHLIKAGANKAIGVPGIEITNDQLATIQQRVDVMMTMFSAGVTRGRGGAVTAERMDGSDWFGADAQKYGLIDEVIESVSAFTAELQKLTP